MSSPKFTVILGGKSYDAAMVLPRLERLEAIPSIPSIEFTFDLPAPAALTKEQKAAERQRDALIELFDVIARIARSRGDTVTEFRAARRAGKLSRDKFWDELLGSAA